MILVTLGGGLGTITYYLPVLLADDDDEDGDDGDEGGAGSDDGSTV